MSCCLITHAYTFNYPLTSNYVILSNAKDLDASTNASQIFRASPQQLVFTTLRSIQNDITQVSQVRNYGDKGS